MLRSTNEIKGYTLDAAEGSVGKAKDFLFNDSSWIIRYLVIDTGNWLPGRKVVVSPICLKKPEHLTATLPVKLTKQQIEDSPSLEEHKPVSRQFEIDLHRLFGWPTYWSGDMVWGASQTPGELYREPESPDPEELISEEDGDPHLRSINEVNDYHIMAKDGEIGHVEDFIVDDETWVLRYIVVDTRNWLPGKKVTISPEWIDNVDYGEALVHMDLSRQQIKDSPEYDPRTPINREYELRLYDFYSRPYYW